MTRTLPSQTILVMALLATLGLAQAFPGGPLSGFASPAFAQDDDGGDDDGGSDDDDDDRGGNADNDDDRGRDAQVGGRDDDAAPVRSPRTSTARNVVPLPVRAEDEVVVTGLTDQDLAALQAEGFAVIETLLITRNGPVLHRLRIPPGTSLEQARDQVRARDSGRNADFNHYYRTSQDITPAAAPPSSVGAALPDTCTHLNCPFLNQIAWPAERPPGCRADMTIGVIDTSVNLDHAGLASVPIELVRVAADDLPGSGETHGTAVAALLAGNEARAPGLLPEARIVAVDIFSREGGDERADVVHLVRALDLLAERGVRVANLSLAGPENTVLTDMLAAVADSGLLVVAAVGNAGPAAPPSWPATAQTVLAVTAVDSGDRIYRRAQRGAHVDVAAPGVEVWSAASVRGVKPRTGTSFATPFATAAAAILMSRDPDMTPAEAIDALRARTRDTGAAGDDDVFGAGVLSLSGLCG